MSTKAKLVLIVAMRREVQPLLAECEKLAESPFICRADSLGVSHPQLPFRCNGSIVVCCGPGYKNASRATQRAIESFAPEMAVSLGFAGALTPELRVGDIFMPRHIVSERTGSAFTSPRGRGTLVTAERVAGPERKSVLVGRFRAQAVDMEAAAVASVAAARDCEFLALKVISDTLDSRVDFVSPYVRPEGFRTGAFLAHISVRPWLWPAVHVLRRNSSRAAESLCRAVRVLVSEGSGVVEGMYAPVDPLDALRGD
jgi:adenosylhomocysteine nucleosidase